MNERNRQVAVTGLIILAVLIFGALAYLAFVIQQNQAPIESEAAGTPLTECILGLRPDVIPFYQQNGWDITQRDAIVSNWSGIAPDEYAAAAATCSGVSASSSGGATDFTDGSRICGDTCVTNADCADPSGSATATCRNGTCENTLCPAGQTQPGTICSCNAQNACGQQCSGSLGLCQAGSTCAYLASNSTCNTTTYCVPTNVYTTLSTCSGGADRYYTGSVSSLSSLCNPASCGDGVCNNNETRAICPTDCPVVCGDAICSSGESGNCAADCVTGTSLPNTSIISDEVDRLIIGAALLLVGLVILSYHKREFSKKPITQT
jgi:hypothetical protein